MGLWGAAILVGFGAAQAWPWAERRLGLGAAAGPAPQRRPAIDKALRAMQRVRPINPMSRQVLLGLFREAGPCTEGWCDDARDLIESWLQRTTRYFDDVGHDEIECSAAACWVQIRMRPINRFREFLETAQDVAVQDGWHHGYLLGGGDARTEPGVALSVWVLQRPPLPPLRAP